MGISKISTRAKQCRWRWIITTICIGLYSHARADLAELMSASQEPLDEHSWLENISANEMEMLMGPAINRLANSEPSEHSRGSSAGPGGRYSARHVLMVGYKLSAETTISPVLDFSQALSGDQGSDLTMNDPQVKWCLSRFFENNPWHKVMRTNLTVGIYVPVSQRSRYRHSQGAILISTAPRFRLGGNPRFSLSGLLSLKEGFYNPPTTGSELVSGIIFGGIQENYRLSDLAEIFLMTHVNFATGARIPMSVPAIPAEVLSGDRAMHTVALMTGIRLDASKRVAITPRFDWAVSRPLSETTVGLNMMIHLI